jgi:hypothetical protein
MHFLCELLDKILPPVHRVCHGDGGKSPLVLLYTMHGGGPDAKLKLTSLPAGSGVLPRTISVARQTKYKGVW